MIGAGSVKCAAALGLQKALQREGVGLDMVVGCSGGSLYATLIALGYDAETMQGQCAEWAGGIIFQYRHASSHSGSLMRGVKSWRNMIFYAFQSAGTINEVAMVRIIRQCKVANCNMRDQGTGQRTAAVPAAPRAVGNSE